MNKEPLHLDEVALFDGGHWAICAKPTILRYAPEAAPDTACREALEEIASYKKAIAIKPEYAAARYVMGLDNDEYEAAIADAYHNMGSAYAIYGRHADAIAAFKKTIAIKPERK